MLSFSLFFFFFQAEDGIRDGHVTGVQTCALPISVPAAAGRFRCPRRGGLVRGPEIHRSLAGLSLLDVPRRRPRTRARSPRPALDAPDGDRVPCRPTVVFVGRSEEHTSELQSLGNLVCRL